MALPKTATGSPFSSAQLAGTSCGANYLVTVLAEVVRVLEALDYSGEWEQFWASYLKPPA